MIAIDSPADRSALDVSMIDAGPGHPTTVKNAGASPLAAHGVESARAVIVHLDTRRCWTR